MSRGRSADVAFGSLPVLVCGDFRQIPPVLRHVDSAAFAASTLKACAFWTDVSRCRHYKLRRNKRAEGDDEYASFLLAIGNGTFTGETADSAIVDSDEVPAAMAQPNSASSLPKRKLLRVSTRSPD